MSAETGKHSKRGLDDDEDAEAPPIPNRGRSSPNPPPPRNNNNDAQQNEKTALLQLASAIPAPCSLFSHNNSNDDNNDGDESSAGFSQYPGAVPVLPGVDRSRAHLEALKAAEQDGLEDRFSNNTSFVRTGAANATEGPDTALMATVVSGNQQEELEHLRNLVENAVSAENVTVSSNDGGDDANNKKPSATTTTRDEQKYSAGDTLTPALHAQEGLAEQWADRITENAAATSNMKITRKKKTFKDACCGNHAVVLDSVIIMDPDGGTGATGGGEDRSPSPHH